MPRSPDTLLVINTLMNGGAQRQLVILARELKRAGYDVGVFHYGESEAMARVLDGTGVPIISLARRGMPRFLIAAAALLKLLRLRPKRLVSFIDAANILAGLYSKLTGSTWVPSERSLSIGPPRAKDRLWRRFLYQSASAVTCNSHAQLHWVRSHFASLNSRSIYVGNAVGDEYLSQHSAHHPPRSPFRFLVLGRVAEEKNPWLLVRALELVGAENCRRLQIDWFGDDDPGAPGMRTALVEWVTGRALPLRFHRSAADVVSLLDQSHGLILCSKYEGTPNVVLEAMARKRPVLASNVSDVPLVLGNGARGRMFDSESPESLASAILELLASVGENDETIESAYEYVVRNHSAQAMASSYASLLGLHKQSA